MFHYLLIHPTREKGEGYKIRRWERSEEKKKQGGKAREKGQEVQRKRVKERNIAEESEEGRNTHKRGVDTLVLQRRKLAVPLVLSAKGNPVMTLINCVLSQPTRQPLAREPLVK